MERIVLRHLSGSKSNQVEEFPIRQFRELTIGRDASSNVRYDPDRDDLIGRQHAKIVADPATPGEFRIVDLNSRNGTYVNGQRIFGETRVAHGDVIQFGPGGPRLQFEVEPRPPSGLAPTRVAKDQSAYGSGPGAAAPTREADARISSLSRESPDSE